MNLPLAIAPPAPIIGIDVGGTTIKAELVGTDGAVLHRTSAPTPHGQAAALDAIEAVGRGLIEHSPSAVGAAGVVVPGLVDRTAGVATYSGNIGWRDMPLVAEMQRRWNLPTVRLANDVAAGGVAEYRLGAGHGHEHLLFIPIGTGIAGAIVSAGRLLSGHTGETAEIGHIPITTGVSCVCGADGCLEAVASAAAIARRYAGRVAVPPTSVSAADVAARLADDAAAREVWREAIDALALAITITSQVLSPGRVIIGGGLSDAGEALLSPLRDAVGRMARVVEPPEVVGSDFGARAGVVGAALLAADNWETES